MHPATKTAFWGTAVAVVSGGTMLNALRNGHLRASRSFCGRRIYRVDKPKLFWINVVLLGAFCALGMILAAWALASG